MDVVEEDACLFAELVERIVVNTFDEQVQRAQKLDNISSRDLVLTLM